MKIRTLLLPALLGLGLAGGCEGKKVDDQEVKAQAKQAGREIEHAAEKAGDVAQDAAEKGVDATKQAAAKAKDAIQGHDDDRAARRDSVRPGDTVQQ
jgi:hypothetical protein